jgi:hypothetical protein
MTNSHPVPTYKRIEEWNSGSVDTILRRYKRNGFTGYVIQGERGLGKSMYAYKVMAKTYLNLGKYRSFDTGEIIPVTNELEAYKAALEYMIFSPDDLIRLIEFNIQNDYVTPVLCLDDATVHFNSYMFFVDLHTVILLKGMFDTIRTVLSGLLMTCPKRRNLLSFLRDYDDYKISIKYAPGHEETDRLARCYQFNWYPDDRKYRVQIPFQDKFSCWVPDTSVYPEWSPYDRYMKKRKSYLLEINDKLKEIRKVKAKKCKHIDTDVVDMPEMQPDIGDLE